MLPNNNKDTFTIVIVVILFFIFFMPKIEKKHAIEEYNLESDINNKFK